MNQTPSGDVPVWIEALREGVSAMYLRVIDDVWTNQSEYIKWPARSVQFMSNVTRSANKSHRYSVDQRAQIKAVGLPVDSRSNGPAVMAYGLARGERPTRASGRHKWTIHHIYDGQFPAPGTTTCTRAAIHEKYFTESAGLVAIHPIADALADEFAYFAWLLRYEAFQRFNFDPDSVFGSKPSPVTTAN